MTSNKLNNNRIKIINFLSKRVNKAVIIELFDRNKFNSMAGFYKDVVCFEENGTIYISNGKIIYIISPIIISDRNGYNEFNEIIEGQLASNHLWLSSVIEINFDGNDTYSSEIHEMNEILSKKDYKIIETRHKKRMVKSDSLEEIHKGLSHIDSSKRDYYNFSLCMTLRGDK